MYMWDRYCTGATPVQPDAEKALLQQEADVAAAAAEGVDVEVKVVPTGNSAATGISAQRDGGGSVAAKLALEYNKELNIMEQMLRESGVQLPRHFSHAQLMRFAIPHGLLKVRGAPRG